MSADWPVFDLGDVRVERIGVDGRPTGWRITRQGSVVARAESDSLVNALLLGISLAQHGTDEWVRLVKVAVAMADKPATIKHRRQAA